MTSKQYISLSKAGKIYDYTPQHLGLMIRRGKLKAIRIGGKWVTTLEWLEQYKRFVEKNNKCRKKFKKTKRPLFNLQFKQAFKKALAFSLISLLLFAFVSTAYVAAKEGGFFSLAKDSFKSLVSNITKAPSQTIQEILGQTTKTISEDMASVLSNRNIKPLATKISDIAKTIARGYKRVDRISNQFFGNIFSNVFAFIDNLFSKSGHLVINTLKTSRHFFVRLPGNLKNLLTLDFFIPSYPVEITNQSFITIKDLYKKLSELRDKLEGEKIVIQETIYKTVKEVIVTRPIEIQKEVIKDQVVLADWKADILTEVDTRLSTLETTIYETTTVENIYYYTEAAKVGGFNVVNNEVDFNESVNMNKSLTVVGSLAVDGTVTFSSTSTFSGDASFSGLASFANTLSITTNGTTTNQLQFIDSSTDPDRTWSITNNDGDFLIQDSGNTRIKIASSSVSYASLIIDSNGDINIDATASISNDLRVTGQTTIAGNFDLSGIFTADTAASHSFTGDLAIGDDLAITGEFTDGILTITGGDISSGGHFAFATASASAMIEALALKTDTLSNSSGTLTINAFTLGGDVTGGNYDITGLTDFGAVHASISDDLTVSDVFTARDGLVSISDDFYVGDDLLFADISAASISMIGGLEVSAGLNINSGVLYIDNGGSNVGIGTTEPGAELHVKGSVIISAYTGLTGDDGKLQFVDAENDGYYRYYDGDEWRSLAGASISYGDIWVDHGGPISYSGGNVGIGTVNPSVKFAVDGTASVSGNFDMFGTFTADTAASHSFTGDLAIGDDLAITGEFTDGILTITGGDISSGGHFAFATASASAMIEALALKTDTLSNSSGTLTINAFTLGGNITGANYDITGLTYLEFDNASASEDIEVAGYLKADYLDIESSTTSSSFAGDLDIEGDVNIGNGDLQIDASSGNVYINNGNVGIGTTNPSQILHIYKASGEPRLRVESDDAPAWMDVDGVKTSDGDVGGLVFYNAGDSIAALSAAREGANDAGALKFYTQKTGEANTERMRIDSTGEVGIGTTGPRNDLEINFSTTGESINDGLRIQNIHGVNDDIAPLYFGVHSSNKRAKAAIGLKRVGAYGYGDLLFAVDSELNLDSDVSFATDTKMVIKHDGKVGIGTTSPSTTLHVAGHTNDNIPSLDSDTELVISNSLNTFNDLEVSLISGNDQGYIFLNFGDPDNEDAAFLSWRNDATAGNEVFSIVTPGGELKLLGQTGDFNFNSGDVYFENSTGYVGIGTGASTPRNDLEINFSTTGESINDGLRIQNIHGVNDDIAPLYFGVHSSNKRAKAAIGLKRVGAYGYGDLLFAVDSQTNSDTDVSFATDTKMVIKYDGNVGIGTTDPRSELHIASNDTAGLIIHADADGNSTNVAYIDFKTDGSVGTLRGNIAVSEGTSGLPLELNSAVSNDVVMVTGGGNVGIGTTNPSKKLEVQSTIEQIAEFENTGDAYGRILIDVDANADAQIAFQENAATKWTIGNDGSDSDKLKFMPAAGPFAGSEVVTIQSDGNVGIGTTTPDAKFDVAGSGIFDNELIVVGALQVAHTASAAYSRFGTGTTGHSLANANDLLISGNLEVDSEVWIDSDLTVSGQIYASEQDWTDSGLEATEDLTPNTVFLTCPDGWYLYKVQLNDDDAKLSNGWCASPFKTNGSSDRNIKENFTLLNDVLLREVELSTWTTNDGSIIDAIEYDTEMSMGLDNQELLNRLSMMPIMRWNFINDDDYNEMESGQVIHHIGPVAQDFYKLFGLGSSDTRIKSMDLASVALAGIKALNEEMQEQQTQIQEIKNQLSAQGGPASGWGLNLASSSGTVEDNITITNSTNPLDFFTNLVNGLKDLGITIKDGIITAVKLVVDEVKTKILRANTISITIEPDQDNVVDRAVFPAQQVEYRIENSLVQENSEIFISFRSDTGGKTWHISEVVPGSGFTIRLSEVTPEELEFSYWILLVENSEQGTENNIQGGGYCGDDILQPGEECDDNNNIDGDGCDATCMIEPPLEELLASPSIPFEEPLASPSEEPIIEEPPLESSSEDLTGQAEPEPELEPESVVEEEPIEESAADVIE